MADSTKPLISVIVPIYKVESYLRTCIESICTQTYTNLEIILVDDGSPDKCPQICDEYAQKDKRIKVIHKNNGGLACARNTGLDITQGEYICFVDGDDFINSKNIQALFQLSMKYDAGIAIGKFQTITFNDTISKNNIPIHEECISSEQSIYRFTALDTSEAIQNISLGNKLYKTTLFSDVRCPEGKNYEDSSTTYKLLFHANTIAYTTEAIYYYVIRTDSIIGSLFTYKNLDAPQAYQEAITYFTDKQRVDLANAFIPPLLMQLMFCYWGSQHILKDKKLANSLLNQYRQYTQNLNQLKTISKFWKLIFKVLGQFPWFYSLYRKYSPLYYNDRKRI